MLAPQTVYQGSVTPVCCNSSLLTESLLVPNVCVHLLKEGATKEEKVQGSAKRWCPIAVTLFPVAEWWCTGDVTLYR